MGRKSVNPNKNIYWTARVDAGLTREAASDMMECISTDTIERIEYGKRSPQPEEVLQMADCYNKPLLCNHYCAHDCPIGEKYVPPTNERSLAEIAVSMLNSLNILYREKENFIQLIADGDISPDEKEEFDEFQEHLKQMAIIINDLNLWSEKYDAE